MFIGIDPGLQGAIAFLNDKNELKIFKVPVIKNSKGKTEYDIYAMIELFKDKQQAIRGVALELVHSMPGQSVVAMFSMGKGLGIWQAILSCLAIPYTMVAPQTWQKTVLKDFKRKAGEAKQASILNAQRMFPKFSFLPTPRCTKVDDNMTDSANIALFAKKHFI